MINKIINKFFPAVLSAILLIGAFPRFNQGYLAWIALIPLIIVVIKNNSRYAFINGLIFGALFHIYINCFIISALEQFVSIYFALVLYFIIVIYISLFYGAVFYLFNRLLTLMPPVKLIFLSSFIWVFMEFLRSLGFLGYTAGFIGYSQWNQPFILNIVSFYGYWGLAFLIVALQILIAMVITGKINGLQIRTAFVVWLIILFSGLFIPDLFPVYNENDSRKIALIQGNISREDILTGQRGNLTTYLELTRDAVSTENEVKMVVWPETVVSARIGGGVAVIPEIRELSEELQVALLYGAIVIEDGKRYNSVVFFDPNNGEPELYFKKILVPIVEYLPAGESLNKIMDIRVRLGSLTPGKDISLFDFNGIAVSGAICFESFFGSYTRKFAAKGARHLFVLTNDGWLRDSIGLDQHAQIITVRAAETGIGVTQLANTGITISANYKGEELLRSGIKTREIIYLETDFKNRSTLYKLAGDYFIYSGLLFFFIICILPAIPLKNPLSAQAVFRHRQNR